jgi:NitT/TauT family transport system permease protein
MKIWRVKSDKRDVRLLSSEHAEYLRRTRRVKAMVVLLRVSIFVGVFVLWEVAARLGWIDAFVMSQPSKALASAMNLARRGELAMHLGYTVGETVAGFVIGTLIGVMVAVFLWWSPFLSRVLEPYVVVLNSIPKVALGPIFIVWLGTNVNAIVAMAIAISVIVTVMMVYAGFREVDPNKIKLLRTFGATKLQVLEKVVIPSSIPVIIAALKVNVGLSLVGTIVGEFLVSRAGLGFLIVYGGQVFNMSLVMSSVILLSGVSVILYYLVSRLEEYVVKWRQ